MVLVLVHVTTRHAIFLAVAVRFDHTRRATSSHLAQLITVLRQAGGIHRDPNPCGDSWGGSEQPLGRSLEGGFCGGRFILLASRAVPVEGW